MDGCLQLVSRQMTKLIRWEENPDEIVLELCEELEAL